VFGGSDTVVPPEQSRAVAAVAPNLWRLVEIEGVDHNDATLLSGDRLVSTVVELAEAIR